MNRILRSFIVLFALLFAICPGLIAQLPDVPPVVAQDNSLPVPGSVMVDPSNAAPKYQVNSFFDVFTEVSLDFAGTPTVKPPLPGDSLTQNLTGVAQFRISLDGGNTFTVQTCPVSCRDLTRSTGGSGDTRTFDTEMLQLDIQGGTLPPGIMIRESPTLQSTGKLYIRESPSKPSMISSFFDVFTELSVDGGNTWIPADGSIRLEAKKLNAGIAAQVPSPMPNGVIEGQITGDPDFDLLSLRNTTLPPPPPPPVGNTTTFSVNMTNAIIIEGGLQTMPTDVSCVCRATGRFSDGTIQSFDTEMLSLNLSGGTLPGGMMIRESPTKASLGRTTISNNPGGGFRVSSFFDVFTELSIDGGNTWTPQMPTTLELADTIPASPGPSSACQPVATYPNDLYPFAGLLMQGPGPVSYSNNMAERNLKMQLTNSQTPLPGLGVGDTRSIIIVCDVQLSPGLGLPFQDVHAIGNGLVHINHSSDNGTTRFFDTEMLALNLSGNSSGGTVMIRESPTLQSTGSMNVAPNGNGFRISSFFDVFTEISFDNGTTWFPSAQASHVTQVLMPPPSNFPTTNFPAPGVYRGSADCAEVMFANGALLRHSSFFDVFTEVALPPAGGSSMNPATGHMHASMSLDGGNSFFDVFTEISMTVHCDASNTTPTNQFFDTEMLQLDIQGGSLPAGIMIRESPTLASTGKTFIRESPTLPSRMSSFFDVFTELSLDGGQTWSPATSSMRMELDSVTTGTITGIKWHDANGNGVKDGAELGLPNWKIMLADTLGNVIDSVLTDAAGNYAFSDVPPGTYRVSEEVQPGWIQTGGSPAYGFWMVPGDTVGGNDFGNFQSPGLTGVKFNDHNGNGVRDPGDEGIPGWEICIFPKNIPNPDVVASSVTGTFSMHLDGPLGSIPVGGTSVGYTYAKRAAITDNQSAIPKNNPRTILAEETRSQLKTKFEDGEIPTEMIAMNFAKFHPDYIPQTQDSFDIKCSLKSILWKHVTKGAHFDEGVIHIRHVGGGGGEGKATFHDITFTKFSDTNQSDPLHKGTRYASFGVVLYDSNNHPIGVMDSLVFTVDEAASQLNPLCMTTDSAGQYDFSPLLPGTWNVIEHQEPCWNQTTPNPLPITVVSGGTIPPIDFGNHERGGTILVSKYYDTNHNQNLDPGEPPMAGVPFVLTNVSTSATLNQVTDGGGKLAFTDLPSGDYQLTETVPAGYTISVPKSGMSQITIQQCETTSVVWLNSAALTDSTFRTATYEDWAHLLALDGKAKRKAVKCTPDKVYFKFNVKVPKFIPPANIPFSTLALKFSMPVETLYVWAGKTKTQPMCASQMSVDPKHTLWTYDFNCPAPPDTGFVIQFDGVGLKGKPIAVTYKWGTKGGTAKPLVVKGALSIKTPTNALGDTMKLNLPRLPMPNLVNVGEDLQVKGVFPLTIGLAGPNDDSNVVLLKKYADVLKALAKDERGQFLLHDSLTPAQCLARLSKLGKPKAGISPDKVNNKLFAQILTLKLNLIASRLGQFPPGLDTLVFDNHKTQATPFDGKSLRDILEQAEYFIRCRGNLKPAINATADDYYQVIRRINGAFSGPIDTISWSCMKIHLRGVLALKQVPFLRAIPGTIQPIVPLSEDPAMYLKPDVFSLSQNYPNPFNPTTTIRFTLPEAAVVTVKVYNMLGQEISTLINHELLDIGEEEIEFNASNLPSGVYFYRITANGTGDEDAGTPGQTFVDVKKMVLIK